MQTLTTIFIALIGGGAVGFMQFLIQRHDGRSDQYKTILDMIHKLEEKITALDGKVDANAEESTKRWIMNARTQILRFDDELREHKKHSYEYFIEILKLIDIYEDYCSEHPKFPNAQAVDAIAHIKQIYRQCKDENSFV